VQQDNVGGSAQVVREEDEFNKGVTEEA